MASENDRGVHVDIQVVGDDRGPRVRGWAPKSPEELRKGSFFGPSRSKEDILVEYQRLYQEYQRLSQEPPAPVGSSAERVEYASAGTGGVPPFLSDGEGTERSDASAGAREAPPGGSAESQDDPIHLDGAHARHYDGPDGSLEPPTGADSAPRTLDDDHTRLKHELVEARRLLALSEGALTESRAKEVRLKGEAERSSERAARLERELAVKEHELRSAMSRVEDLVEEMRVLRDRRYLATDERLRRLQGELRAEAAEARADAERRQAEFMDTSAEVKRELGSSASSASSQAFEEVNSAIERLGDFREQFMEELDNWKREVFAKEHSGLALFVQYFYRILSDLKREAERLPPESDDLVRAVDAMDRLTIRLEDGCGELGLRFKWAQQGDPFSPGIVHDLLSEDDRPRVPEGTPLYVSECVAPGVVEVVNGRELRLRRAVVRVSAEVSHG